MIHHFQKQFRYFYLTTCSLGQRWYFTGKKTTLIPVDFNFCVLIKKFVFWNTLTFAIPWYFHSQVSKALPQPPTDKRPTWTCCCLVKPTRSNSCVSTMAWKRNTSRVLHALPACCELPINVHRPPLVACEQHLGNWGQLRATCRHRAICHAGRQFPYITHGDWAMNSRQAMLLRASEKKMLIMAVKSTSGLRFFLYDYLSVIRMKSCGETPPFCTVSAAEKVHVASQVITCS